ncbi:MAG: hypothetical protein KAW12_02750 [Candidatus Aminicenantes bacterium]|nr:hypothetical protein [Candidatus Aminicenantes bacterium]
MTNFDIDELVNFFDNNDLGDCWDHMPETDFEVNLKKRTHLFSIDSDIAGKLTEIAKSKKMSSQALVNFWLREKIQTA